MEGRIYLHDGGKNLLALNETAYDSEAFLQEMLAKYPDLLAGEQIDTSDPRRWLLVTREMSVAGEDGGRWSLDHLYLDQDAVPTLVEVKRSSDTRIRREVVGQMLDYAANAVAYWPVEEIRARFLRRCEREDEDPDEVLADHLQDSNEPDQFWQQVKTNLQAGRIRMVFLADAIPTELRRVVEFLNEQMDPAEVLAIEVRQYVGEGMKTFVPQVLGQTETARQKKQSTSSGRKPISEREFLTEFEQNRTAEEVAVARRILSWASQQGLKPNFKKGQRGVVFIPELEAASRAYYIVSLQQRGFAVLQMRWLKKHPPFDRAETRHQLHARLAGLAGLTTTEHGMEGYPKLPLSSLTDAAAMDTFLNSLNWIVSELRHA